MALIHCPECNSEVSDAALKCPKCGKQLRKPKRGFFGKLWLILFYAFNAFMAYALFAGLNNVAQNVNPVTEAEKAGVAIGTAIGATSMLVLWVIGAVILGLLALMTRPKS